MSTTEAPAAVITYLDPTTILPDPANPRSKLRDIDAMAASIASVGVLEAITVRYVEVDGVVQPMAVIGHRRLAGAVKAKLNLIPSIIQTDADAQHRATSRMIENLQRVDFTPTEEARGIQQLLDLGMDAATIATDLAIDPAHVEGAIAIGASKTASTLTEKHDLTFDQALVMVEFESDKDTLKLLTVAAVSDPDEFPHTLEQARQERDRKAVHDTASAEWEAKGYAIIDRPAWNDTKTVALHYLKPDAKAKSRITEATHTECPGRAVELIVTYEAELRTEEFCVDWKSHGHVEANAGGSTPRTGPKQSDLSEKEQAAATLKRRTHNAALKAGRAAQDVRRDWLKTMLNAKRVPAGTLKFATETLLGQRIEDADEIFRQITGVDPKRPTKFRGYAPSAAVVAQRAFAAKLPENRLALALFARAAAHIETLWEPNTWDTDNPGRKDLRLAYLTHLVKCGYAPSLIEKVLMGKAKPADVLAQADLIKAAGRTAPKAKSTSPIKRAPATKRTAIRRAK